MRKKSFFLAVFLFSVFLFLQGACFSFQDDSFSLSLWETAKEILYPELNFFKEDTLFSTSSLFSSRGLINLSLPGKTQLTVRGRKVIGIKYMRYNYFSPRAREEKPLSSIEIEQKLQVQARGKIGDKIQVNLDYDDSLSKSEQQKISLVYRGYEDEIIQEIALGDITLALPKTHFTSYSKSLFGARMRAKWQDFYLTGIASVTKGISETKTFTGKTTTEEREIADVSFIKRTYFKFFFDQDYPPPDTFSYTPGSLEVWIDDQDGTNNISGQTVELTVLGEGGESYQGYFDRAYPGEDFTVDYVKGVLKFKEAVKEQCIVAVRYKDKDGNYHPDPGSGYSYRMIMKGEDERYFKFRFWNYYSLYSQKISQEGFSLKIKDLSGNTLYDRDYPEDYPEYQVEVDFDFGIVQVLKPPTSSTSYYYPFFSEDELPSPSHRYSIYATFTRTVDAYVLHSDIVPESERVYVDGVLLTRDKDYIIDYTSGYLSFLNPDIIGSDTRIEVQYEWMPIMGGEATFLGARIEYRPNDNFSLGSTFLSQAAPEPSKIPDVGLAPQAQRVLEADVNFKLEPEISLPGGGRLPLKILFSGEYSRSTRDPNRFGAGMVEDFSAGKVEESLSLSEDSWMPGSRPDIASSLLRDEISISDEEIEGEKVNPIWSEDKITVLKLGFDLTLSEMWDSACYVISSTGKDFSQMRYLEVWTKGITGDIEVYFDVGMVSEDVDEDGILDTEDKNGDGILNPGEDTGILMNFPSGERTVGAGNGKLDTEDLDGDGKLDTEENFSRYLFSEDKKKELSTGWSKYELLLDEPAGGQSWDDVKALVKHVRIWVKGDSFSGEIKFAKILISGDRWEKEGCEVKGVNNYDDPAFPSPFESQDFRNYYEKMFGSTTTSEGKWQKEEALSISTTSLEGGYIQQTFLSKRDFSPYRKICFWIYHDFEGGDFYLRFGSDVEANYYEYTLPLSSVSTGRWIKIEVPFTSPPLEVEGVPSFSEIKQIRIGVRDVEMGIPFFINDIYLTDVQREEGTAQRYYAKTDLSNFLSLSAEYRKVEPPFSVVGGSSTNTFQDYKKWSISSSYLKFMPFSYSRTEEYTHTEKTEGTSLEVVEKDKVLKKSQVYNVGLRFSGFPALSFKGSNTTSDYLSKEPLERGFEDVYDVSLKYPVPLKFPLLPADISASFKFKRSGKEIEETKTQDITRAGSISLPFRPLQNLVLKTSYSTSETVHDEDGDKTPKERTKNLSLDMQASFFKLTPKLQLEGGCKEDSFSSTDPDKRKVSTNFNLSLSLPFRPASFVRLPKTLSTLGWYFTYNLKKEGIYEDTGVLLERFDYQFGISRFSLPDGREKLWVDKTSFGVKQNLSPFPFLTTSLSYGWEEEERTELGTPYLILVKSWPAGQLKFNLNDTPLIKGISSKIFTSSDLVFEYSEKETQKKEISLSTSVQPSLSWRGMFKNPKNLTLTYSYESSTKRGRAWDAEVSSLEFSSTHQLKTGFSTSLLKGLGKIPLLRDLINFKSKVNVSCALTREYNYKKASSGLVEKNQEKWTLETALSSKLSENINTKLGLNFTYYKDKVKLGEDYFSWGGSVWVELVF